MRKSRIFILTSFFLSFNLSACAEELGCPFHDYTQAPIIQTEFVNEDTVFYIRTNQIQDHTKPAVVFYTGHKNVFVKVQDLSKNYKKVVLKNLSHHQMSHIQNNHLDATNLIPLEERLLPNDVVAGIYQYPIYNEKNVIYPSLKWKTLPTQESDASQKTTNDQIFKNLSFLYEINFDPRTYLILAHIEQSNKNTTIILKPKISYPQHIQLNSGGCDEISIKNNETFKISFDILTHDGKIIEWKSNPLYFNSAGNQNLTFWQKLKNYWTIFKLKYLI